MAASLIVALFRMTAARGDGYGELSPVGSNEAGDAEVAKGERHNEEDEEMRAGVVICCREVEGGAIGPDGVCGKEREDAEEGAGEFEPEDAG